MTEKDDETLSVLDDPELMEQLKESKKNSNVRDFEEVAKELGI